jgi:spore coat protein U-like protein
MIVPKLIVASVVLVLMLAAAGPAHAACSISTTAVSFGGYDVFSPTALDAQGQVSVTCSLILFGFTVALDRGGAPSFSPRQLKQGTEPLNYNFYLDAARTIIWGDGTPGTQTFSQGGVIVLPPQTFLLPVYGRIPANQDVTVGLSTNVVVATVSF